VETVALMHCMRGISRGWSSQDWICEIESEKCGKDDRDNIFSERSDPPTQKKLK
jgi:hypothetical protein